MPKLNDTQLVLLSSAAQRDGGSLLPLPGALEAGARVTKAIVTLVEKGLAAERETTDAAAVHRTDGDLRFGVFATEAGLAAIGIGQADDGAAAEQRQSPPGSPERQSKSATVITMLEREGGATLGELVTATDWLPHTTRAALTGLRKKGHVINRSKRGAETCYTIVAAA
jgi:hypothetical protein